MVPRPPIIVRYVNVRRMQREKVNSQSRSHSGRQLRLFWVTCYWRRLNGHWRNCWANFLSSGVSVARIFILLLWRDLEVFHLPVTQLHETSRDCLKPLVVTHEVADVISIRYLDLRIRLLQDHNCWCYEPRAQKLTLPFISAHRILVKRAIVPACFSNVLQRPCHHAWLASLLAYSEHLDGAGYLAHIMYV